MFDFCFRLVANTERRLTRLIEDFLCPSQKAAARFGSSIHSLPGAPITRAETEQKSCTYMLSGIALSAVCLPKLPSLEHDLFSLATPGTQACAAVGGALRPWGREGPRHEPLL